MRAACGPPRGRRRNAAAAAAAGVAAATALWALAPARCGPSVGWSAASPSVEPPAASRGFGSRVLRPLPPCAGGVPADGHEERRRRFACAAGCAEREPELERALSPWAEWEAPNGTGLDMVELMHAFCRERRSCESPFVMAVLWRGDVYLAPCRAEGLYDASLYLIGPEDLSLVLVILLMVQRLGGLPEGPTAIILYLSDYTCLADRHLVGPGVPIFAYLRRETTWLIPWPSSFTLYSAYEVETSSWHDVHRAKHLDNMGPGPEWAKRTAKAFWIGTVTGPWEFAADADMLAIPRLKLLRLANSSPELLHAEWSGTATYGIRWAKGNDTVRGSGGLDARLIANLTGVRRAIYKRLDLWATYKYYINLDGVVLGGRLNKLLAAGGVVLQHDAGYYEHLSALAQPWVHYVPIRYDLSDLLEKVAWLQANDDEARRIAERGQELALRRMRLEDDLCYVWRALEGLAWATARFPAAPARVEGRLRELNFTKVSVVNGSMRGTLEAFWGAPLENVFTGNRRMTRKGIELLRWVWDRLDGMSGARPP